MSSISRTAQFQRIFKILKKHYKPAPIDTSRPVLEQLLFGCCLENAHHDAAEEAFLGLVHNFFDWNEVRVSTVRELAEVMPRVPDPAAAACRVKQALQHVFESSYRFDLEELRKSNLGPAVKKLQAIDGTTPFVVAHVVQNALGGHAIPVDSGTFGALGVLDLATEKDQEAGTVPGLERAISKSKGPEFASLLHQLGADFVANPYAPRLREILLEINPEARDRLPKRRAKRAARDPGTAAAAEQASPGPAKTAPRPKKTSGEPEAGQAKAPKKPSQDGPAPQADAPDAPNPPAPNANASDPANPTASSQPTPAKDPPSGLAKKKPR